MTDATETKAEKLTAQALYGCNSDVRALIDVWVSERRCPLPLCDLFLEFGLEAQAECARWAATEPERSVFDRGNETAEFCGPFPSNGFGGWYWIPDDRVRNANVVPSRIRSLPAKSRSTPLDAILWLLDNWTLPVEDSR